MHAQAVDTMQTFLFFSCTRAWLWG